MARGARSTLRASLIYRVSTFTSQETVLLRMSLILNLAVLASFDMFTDVYTDITTYSITR